MLQVEHVSYFPFQISCKLCLLRALRPGHTQIQHSSWAACLYTAFSLDTACSCCHPRHGTYPITNKKPMEVELIFKDEREYLAISKYSGHLPLPRGGRLRGKIPGGWWQLTASARRISPPKPSWGIAALTTRPPALSQSSP